MRKKPASKRPGPAYEGCAMCDYSGWVRIYEATRDNQILAPVVVRCSCFKVHQQRLADLEAAAQGKQER